MSRALVILASRAEREKAAHWCHKLPLNTRVEFKQSKRTVPQNARLWAMLTEVAKQATHHGVKLSSEDWKLVFMDALGQEVRAVPNLDGTGFVNLGRSSSSLTKDEMSDLMALMEAYAAQHDIKLSEPEADGLKATG